MRSSIRASTGGSPSRLTGLRDSGVHKWEKSLSSLPTAVKRLPEYAILDETAYDVSVAEAPTPLLGTDLLWGFSLYVEFQAGGTVEIAPLPQASE